MTFIGFLGFLGFEQYFSLKSMLYTYFLRIGFNRVWLEANQYFLFKINALYALIKNRV
jgi:hypothetical protein